MSIETRCDVAVVGGGIAGSAVATLLARAGLSVTVLERQEQFGDKVRGEFMANWGVAEACRLGLWDALASAATRAQVYRWMISYDQTVTPDEAEATRLDLSTLLPEVAGCYGLGHPETCEALAQAAVAAGTRMHRGVTGLRVRTGATPEVEYTRAGDSGRVTADLVVAADGRNSLVRRQLGIELHADPVAHMVAGVLAEPVEGFPLDHFALGTVDRLHYYVFPQADGTTRLYLMYPVEDRVRFAGGSLADGLAAAFDLPCFPERLRFGNVQPVRPAAAFPANDTWADTVLAPGVVLLGDAGGYNDPIIGQGLSLALREAGDLAELLVDLREQGGSWAPTDLAPYERQRATRHRRARATAVLHRELFCRFGPEFAARRTAALARIGADTDLAAAFIAGFVGYDTDDEGAFSDERRAAILAA